MALNCGAQTCPDASSNEVGRIASLFAPDAVYIERIFDTRSTYRGREARLENRIRRMFLLPPGLKLIWDVKAVTPSGICFKHIFYNTNVMYTHTYMYIHIYAYIAS